MFSTKANEKKGTLRGSKQNSFADQIWSKGSQFTTQDPGQPPNFTIKKTDFKPQQDAADPHSSVFI